MYCTSYTYSECQDKTPATWVDKTATDLQSLYEVDPGLAAPLISAEHLGEIAARQLAGWHTNQQPVTWA